MVPRGLDPGVVPPSPEYFRDPPPPPPPLPWSAKGWDPRWEGEGVARRR